MSCMSFTSVVVDRACFKKTSDMQESRAGSGLSIATCKFRNGNECKVLCSFIFIFVYDADSLFVSRSFAVPKFKKEVQLFLHCPYLIIYFSQRNP